MNKFNLKSLLAVLLTVVMVFSIVPMFAVSAEEPAATIDFSTVDSRTDLSDDLQVWKSGDLTVTNEKAASTQPIKDYCNPARFYANTSLTIAFPGMTKLEVLIPTAAYAEVWEASYTDGNATFAISESSPTANSSDRLLTVTFSTPVDSFTMPQLTKQTRMRTLSVYAAVAEETVTPVTTTYTFANYKVDGELGGGEATRQLDDNVTFTISSGWFTSEARIYKNANGVIASTNPITSIVLNIGYKNSTFNVYTSEDGVTWTSYKEGVAYTSAYADVTVDFETPVQYIKLDAPNAQIRMKGLSVTMLVAGGSEGGDTPDVPECKHTDTEIVDAKDATETEEGYTGDTVCVDCGATVKTGEKIPVKTPATEPEAPAFGVITAPKAGVAYKFGMVQGNLNKTYYLKGGMSGYYMATSENVADAIDVYLEETEGGYYLYTMVDGVKTYINMVVSGTHVNGAYEATASTVYTWDAEHNTIISVVGGKDYWHGTRNDKTYTTVGPCATSYNGFYCQFYGVEVEEPACEHKNTEIVGKVEATETTEGYTGDTKCTDCGETIATGEKIPVKVPEVCPHTNTEIVGKVEATETTEGYTGDKVCTKCGETVEKGEKIPVKTPATEPEAPAFGVITAPKAGVAYKFGMVQGNLNKTFYLKGGMNGYYMDTTENVDAAIDVYLEETEGGYYLYTMVDGVKTYINMVVSGTHVNGAYEATATTVYKWNAEKNTITAEVNGADYWFGTRNDKTYTTVGPVKVEYDGFYCQFYGVEVEEPTPAPTGDVMIVVIASVLVAGAALTVISRKRRFN